MAAVHSRFAYEFVVLVGDNLYGSERPQDFKKKFEQPYKALLDAGVRFYASLGNHDEREGQRYYKLFNMDGKLYYTFKAPKQSVRFFALDSTYADPAQSAWLEKELQ
jgi:predicted MPP superfamily phosphohydrolase